jgi:O-6-methylguanine DNA methyltransferase
MTAQDQNQGRVFIENLRAIREAEAPATLLPSVMIRVGLGDSYTSLTSPIGPVFVAYNGTGISAVMRVADEQEFEQVFRERFGRRIYPASELPQLVQRAWAAHFSGQAVDAAAFDLRELSEFERAVLEKALNIPYGEVRSYAWIAREIGRPKAVRAVGTALGHNPVPLLIPCHRVVRSDGMLGQYSMGGPEVKRAVLAAEGLDPVRIEQQARAGVRYVGSDTTHIYCYPTCSDARRITDQHRVTFTSERAAAQAGYRPCKRCRPLASAV